jgi:hypothetical protein
MPNNVYITRVYCTLVVMVDALLWVGLSCWVVVVMLILHHAYTHSDLPYPDRCFQMSDICNFHSCSHEMWVILIFFGGVVCIVAGCT